MTEYLLLVLLLAVKAEMSQIGIDTHVAETIIINSSAHNRLPGEDNFDENGRYMQAFIDYNTARGVTLLTFSIIGLLGNVLTILLVAVAPRLRKPQNSFFVHQCILDAVKSAYCLVFSKVRYWALHREEGSAVMQ